MVIVDRHVGDDPDDDHRPDEQDRNRAVNDFIIDFARKNEYSKPMVVAMTVFGNDPSSAASAARLRREFATAGIPAYSSSTNAARALARFVRYHQFRAKTADRNP
jgi:acyl-CoA synthetase (NDP forming)